MSGKATGQVWEMDLDRPTKYLLLALAEHANHDGEHIFPGVDLIAWKTGYTARNVQRMLRELEGAGIIVPEGPTTGGAGRTTCYRIDFDAAPKLPTRRTKRVTSPHTNDDEKGDIPAHQKGDIPAQKRVTSPRKKGDISSRAPTSLGLNEDLNRQEPSSTTVIFSADAEEVVLRFCEITNAEFMAMPPATVRAQEDAADRILADYGRADVEGCMRWLQTWRRVPWTMATVRKEIDEWIAKGRPSSGKTEAAPPARASPTLDPARYKNGGHLSVRGRPT